MNFLPSLKMECLKRVLRSGHKNDAAIELGVAAYIRIVLGDKATKDDGGGATWIDMRLACLDLALMEGMGLQCVDTLRSRLDYFFDLVMAGEKPAKTPNPGNPKKRANGARRGSG